MPCWCQWEFYGYLQKKLTLGPAVMNNDPKRPCLDSVQSAWMERDWMKICTLFGRGGAFGLVVLWSEGKEKISSGSGFIVTLMIQIWAAYWCAVWCNSWISHLDGRNVLPAFGNFDGKKQILLTEFHQVWQIFLLNCSQGFSLRAAWAFRSAGTSHSVLPILGSLVSKAIPSSLNPFAELRV